MHNLCQVTGVQSHWWSHSSGLNSEPRPRSEGHRVGQYTGAVFKTRGVRGGLKTQLF